MASRQIDNRKPPEPQPDGTVKKIAFVVGTTVRDAPCHPPDGLAMHWGIVYKIELTTDSAHNYALTFAADSTPAAC